MAEPGLKSLMDKIKRTEKGEQFLVVPLLEKHYAAAVERPKTQGNFSPSDLGGCIRNAFFAFQAVPKERVREPMSYATLDDGRYRHDRWRTALTEAGLMVVAEKELWIPEWHVHGFTDGVLLVNDLEWVYELKGARQETFNRIVKNGPELKDKIQMHIYMRALEIPRGVLIYENKNDQRTPREFVFYKPDPVTELELEARMECLMESVESGGAPGMPEECRPNTTMRTWCDRSKHCLKCAAKEAA